MTEIDQKQLGNTLWGIAASLTIFDDLITAQTQNLGALIRPARKS